MIACRLNKMRVTQHKIGAFVGDNLVEAKQSLTPLAYYGTLAEAQAAIDVPGMYIGRCVFRPVTLQIDEIVAEARQCCKNCNMPIETKVPKSEFNWIAWNKFGCCFKSVDMPMLVDGFLRWPSASPNAISTHTHTQWIDGARNKAESCIARDNEHICHITAYVE